MSNLRFMSTGQRTISEIVSLSIPMESNSWLSAIPKSKAGLSQLTILPFIISISAYRFHSGNTCGFSPNPQKNPLSCGIQFQNATHIGSYCFFFSGLFQIRLTDFAQAFWPIAAIINPKILPSLPRPLLYRDRGHHGARSHSEKDYPKTEVAFVAGLGRFPCVVWRRGICSCCRNDFGFQHLAALSTGIGLDTCGGFRRSGCHFSTVAGMLCYPALLAADAFMPVVDIVEFPLIPVDVRMART